MALAITGKHRREGQFSGSDGVLPPPLSIHPMKLAADEELKKALVIARRPSLAERRPNHMAPRPVTGKRTSSFTRDAGGALRMQATP